MKDTYQQHSFKARPDRLFLLLFVAYRGCTLTLKGRYIRYNKNTTGILYGDISLANSFFGNHWGDIGIDF